MSPYQNDHNTRNEQSSATSPRTETYPAGTHQQADQSKARAAAKRFNESDEPTHNALSDIYNRPY